MLDEHLLDGFHSKMRVERLLAEKDEGVEGCGVGFVRLVFGADDSRHLTADLREAVLELGNCFLPLIERWRLILEKAAENRDEVVGAGDLAIKNALTILHEHSASRFLEKDVIARVAELDFALISLSRSSAVSFASQSPCMRRKLSTSAPSGVIFAPDWS